MKNDSLLNYFSQQVNLYLDDRLTEESKENLLEAVKNDSRCSKVLESEKHFRNFIKSNAKRTSVSEDLIKSIKSKIS